MKLSTRSRYGTRAMFEIAKHFDKAPVKRREITKAQNISNSYLENILITLKDKQLITTTRGANGGFLLRQSPSKTSLYEIVTALEGSIAPIECVERPAACKKSGHCVARRAWSKLHHAQSESLKSVSLQDMLDMESEGSPADYVI